MQLLFNIDADVNIQRKMTAIEQESLSLPENFTNKEIIEKENEDNVNVVNESSITNTLQERVGNGNLKSKDSNSENINIENLDNNENRDSNKEVFKNSGVEVSSSPIENVPTHLQGSNISREIQKEEQHNIDHKINQDYESDKDTNTNLKYDVIDLGSHVEKTETNIEIKVDIEVKKGSLENEQKIDPITLSKNKENSENSVDMKISTSSTSEETPVNEETNILKSVLNSNDRNDLKTNVELDMKMAICDETGEIDVTEKNEIKSRKDNKEEHLHGVESVNDNKAEMLYNENDKILEESMEMKPDVELYEKESNLKLIYPIQNKILDIESREKVDLELQAISNLEQSTGIEDELLKENKEVEETDITDAIGDVNKEITEKEISDEIVGEQEEEDIDEKDIKTSDNLNEIKKITTNEEPEIIQTKKLEINVEESANVKPGENNVNKEIKGTELSVEMIEANKEINENNDKSLPQSEEETRLSSGPLTGCDDDDDDDNDDDKRSNKETKINEIIVEEQPKKIQGKELEINVEESTRVIPDKNVKVMEVDEPELLHKEEISKISDKMTKINENVVEKEAQIIQSKESEINTEELAKLTPDKNMEVIELNEPDLEQTEKVSATNQDEIDLEVIGVTEKSSNFIKDEIIDVPDEIYDVEDIPEYSSDTDFDNNDIECEKTKANRESENRSEVKSGTEAEDEQNVQNVEKTKPFEKKKLSHICKLSNTLDILSDEEEDSDDVPSFFEKNCINIEDDDDIMLIDEEITKDNCTDVVKLENNENKTEESVENNNTNLKENVAMDVCESKTDNIVKSTEKELQEQKPEEQELERPMQKIPLLPKTILKTCKKSLAEMTRDELEEFCVMKIGESVIDRSKLNEISTQLKVMTSNIEEYKKKTNTLMKQNRDLQVVLKSVQEEQKKGSNTPITPLKITRSVGMQVFMMEKPTGRKKPLAANNFQRFGANKVLKSHTNQSPKAAKVQTNPNQHIPVPRLVPAVNSTTSTSNKTPAPAALTKVQGGPVPNGVWNSNLIQKAEKRPHSKVQNSVTVDLTDDEPPAKISQRTVTPPVRLIPQQNLLATQRPQFANNSNSPKKVYIPIGAAQNQVRSGHTIMLKQVSQGQRMRTPNTLPKQSVAGSVRMTRIASRHPAPLPDSMKQYQPPNWKALPPTPELKLSKVDNGIVISWKISDYQEEDYEEIASYQLYAYQETSSPPNTALWKKIGDVKALPLPMACTLTQFMSGYKYYFAVRAVDIRSRVGPFSLPGSILLLNKM